MEKQLNLTLDDFKVILIQNVHAYHTLVTLTKAQGLTQCCIHENWLQTAVSSIKQGTIKGFLAVKANTNEPLLQESIQLSGVMMTGLIDLVASYYNDELKKLIKEEYVEDGAMMNMALKRNI